MSTRRNELIRAITDLNYEIATNENNIRYWKQSIENNRQLIDNALAENNEYSNRLAELVDELAKLIKTN